MRTAGFEPTTAGFGIQCSTTELSPQYSTNPGLEPGTSWSVVRCAIHYASRPFVLVSIFRNRTCDLHRTTNGALLRNIWSSYLELNQGPIELQSTALPLSYTSIKRGMPGLEPGSSRPQRNIMTPILHSHTKNDNNFVWEIGLGGFRSHYLNVANVTRFRLRHKPINLLLSICHGNRTQSSGRLYPAFYH